MCLDCAAYPALGAELLCPECIEVAAKLGYTAAERVTDLRSHCCLPPAPEVEARGVFRIARNPDVPAPELALARRYSRLEDACADMGDGLVFRDDGSIVIFHVRHFRLLAHRGVARMTAIAT